MNYQKFVYGTAIVFTVLTSCKKTDQPATVTYFPTVKTIITNKCLSCHNSNDQSNWAGRPTRFDTDADITAAYAAIKASVADPATPTNRRMPRSGDLPAAEVDTIVKWFNKGGKSSD